MKKNLYEKILQGQFCDYSIVKKFSNAKCNEVFLLQKENKKVVVKYSSNSIRIKELEKEKNLLDFFEKKINVPKVLSVIKNANYMCLYLEYVDGKIKSRLSNEDVKNYAKILKNIHSFESSDNTIEELLIFAEHNFKNNLLDNDEFVQNGKILSQSQCLDWLKQNKTNFKDCVRLHGDFRPKNILINNGIYTILDFGLSFVGDIYYDFAILFYYLNQNQKNIFIKEYGLKSVNEKRLYYCEMLSKFLNL